MLSTTLFALAQAAEQPKTSSFIQTMILVVVVTFVFSVIVTKFVAKAANVNDATFGKAFLATIFKNMARLGIAGVPRARPRHEPDLHHWVRLRAGADSGLQGGVRLGVDAGLRDLDCGLRHQHSTVITRGPVGRTWVPAISTFSTARSGVVTSTRL